jgi:hypothetical protein
MSLIRLFSPKHFDQQHQENQSINSIIILKNYEEGWYFSFGTWKTLVVGKVGQNCSRII